MNDKLKQLYDALLDRGLSLLPPKGDPISRGVTEEAVMIYEALVASPLCRAMGIPEPLARPAKEPNPVPAPDMHGASFLFVKTCEEGTMLHAGAILRHRSALPKGHMAVAVTKLYRTGDAIPCFWHGDGPWPSQIERWDFDHPVPGSTYATSTPHPEAKEAPTVPVASVGVVYPKAESTPSHDTCVIPVGTRLAPGTYAPAGFDRIPPSIVTVAPFLGRTGDALLCRTVDGSPWASDVVTWTINEPPAGCYPTASRAAPRA